MLRSITRKRLTQKTFRSPQNLVKTKSKSSSASKTLQNKTSPNTNRSLKLSLGKQQQSSVEDYNRMLFDKLDASVIDPIKTLESRICPVPAENLQEKFKYFYGPYNYAINTGKYMSFDGRLLDQGEGTKPLSTKELKE